jgi:hypothetical protein
LLPVVLLASPLIAIRRQAMLAIVAFAVLLPPLMVAAAPAIAYAAHRAGVPPPAAHGQLLAERLQHEWRQVTDRPLLLVGGELDLSYTTAFYLGDRPAALPTGLPRLAPWVSRALPARHQPGLPRATTRVAATTARTRTSRPWRRAPGSRRVEVESRALSRHPRERPRHRLPRRSAMI